MRKRSTTLQRLLQVGNKGPDVQNISNRAAPIIPNPDKPAFLTPDGKPRRGAEEPYHFERFDEFRSFGDIFNSWRGSTPFRLQELLETKITYRKEELDLGPNYGHRYDVYHFQSRVGLLQIHASRVVMQGGWLYLEPHDGGVCVSISLDAFSEHTLPFKEVKGFLTDIARMLSSESRNCESTEHRYHGMTQRGAVLHVIEQAILEAIWDNQARREHDAPAPLTLWFQGTPTEWYESFSQLSGGR